MFIAERKHNNWNDWAYNFYTQSSDWEYSRELLCKTLRWSKCCQQQISIFLAVVTLCPVHERCNPGILRPESQSWSPCHVVYLETFCCDLMRFNGCWLYRLQQVTYTKDFVTVKADCTIGNGNALSFRALDSRLTGITRRDSRSVVPPFPYGFWILMPKNAVNFCTIRKHSSSTYHIVKPRTWGRQHDSHRRGTGANSGKFPQHYDGIYQALLHRRSDRIWLVSISATFG